MLICVYCLKISVFRNYLKQFTCTYNHYIDKILNILSIGGECIEFDKSKYRKNVIFKAYGAESEPGTNG